MATYETIEKKVVLHAPISRVWKVIASADEFGRWFGVTLAGEFVAGKEIIGAFGEELNEAAVHDYEKKLGLTPSKIRLPEKNAVFCVVERIEPEHYFSFKWIPFGINAEVDPKNEPMTLVEFKLESVSEGTLLTIVESGFEHVPEKRRQRAFVMNEGGWAAQLESIQKYLASN